MTPASEIREKWSDSMSYISVHMQDLEACILCCATNNILRGYIKTLQGKYSSFLSSGSPHLKFCEEPNLGGVFISGQYIIIHILYSSVQ